MRNTRLFGQLFIAALGTLLIAAGPALAARRSSDAGNRSAGSPRASSRSEASRPQAGRSAPSHSRSAANQRQPAPARERPSAGSSRSGASRREGNIRASENRPAQAERRKASQPSREQPKNSGARSAAGGRSAGGAGAADPNRVARENNARQQREQSAGGPKNRPPKPQGKAPDVRRNDRPSGKGPDLKAPDKPRGDSPRGEVKRGGGPNVGDSPRGEVKRGGGPNVGNSPRGEVKRGGGPNVGNRPVPKSPGGNVKPRPENRPRPDIKDAHRRLDPPKRPPEIRGPGNARHKPNPDQHKPPHQYRPKPGDVDRLAAGKRAKAVRLAEQYRLHRQGDVARRMGLYRHDVRHDFHHGPISPKYHHHAFKHHYWGPSLFVGVHWYPRWSPWVRWSWGYSIDPYWDPRPVYCRPIVYAPAATWVYWDTPVWTPLPEAASGTWIDLPSPPMADPRFDLQLVAVRFVDAGHPDEKLGPRYRVWFRNNSNRAIGQPFDVMLFAGENDRLAEGLPQAGVRATGIGAGEVQSVDIRLPVEVYAMGRDAKGNPTPFSVLHVLVDAREEIAETTKADNGASLAPADVLPVDPAAFETDPAAAKPGGEVVLAGEGFGPQPGQVLLIVGGREIDAEIIGWYDLGVRFALPEMALAAPTEAEVVVVRVDGAAANPLKITLTP